MAISKKRLRPIVVDSHKFYWKFTEKVFVFNEADKNSLLVVDFGYYDVWLYINDKENCPPDFEPKVVTPKFVSQCIQFALQAGWTTGKMELEYKNETYRIKN